MNGFSTGEEDSRGAADQICCLVDEGTRCTRPAGNASYSKRIQKTVTQRKLKLNLDNLVSKFKSFYSLNNVFDACHLRSFIVYQIMFIEKKTVLSFV